MTIFCKMVASWTQKLSFFSVWAWGLQVLYSFIWVVLKRVKGEWEKSANFFLLLGSKPVYFLVKNPTFWAHLLVDAFLENFTGQSGLMDTNSNQSSTGFHWSVTSRLVLSESLYLALICQLWWITGIATQDTPGTHLSGSSGHHIHGRNHQECGSFQTPVWAKIIYFFSFQVSIFIDFYLSHWFDLNQ